jgi:hypothetical protein
MAMTKKRLTRDELLAEIRRSWDLLTEALGRLPAERIESAQDSQGWTVQDHIAHLTAWERSVIALLQGRERFQGLGVEEGTYLSRDYDRINGQIYRRNKGCSLERIIDGSRAVHDQLLASVEGLTDADLQRPVRAFLPEDSKDDDGRMVVDLVHANTAEHYREHLGYMEVLTRDTP